MIDIDLMKVKDNLFGYIFDSICSIFPFHGEKAAMPADPVYTTN